MVAETEITDAEAQEVETESTAVALHDDGVDIPALAPQVSQATTLLAVIERAASNPDVDIEKMERLLEMRAKEEDRQRAIAREDADDLAKRQFLAAFALVQAEIGPIFRSRENTHTRSRYADLADIDRIVTPILTKHGFSTTSTPLPCETQGCLRMQMVLGHSGGHERVYADDFPLDAAGAQGNTNKTGIQAKGSTQSYARRYLKASALDLAFTDDNDGNARRSAGAAEPISADKLQMIRKELEELGGDEAGMCEYLKVPSLKELPADRFGDAMAALGIKRHQQDNETKAARRRHAEQLL